MALVELVLYDGFAATGTVQWSTTSGTGPWTDAVLSEPLPLRAALAEWSTTITTDSGDTVAFSYADGAVTLYGAEAASIYIQLSAALAELFGFSTLVHFLEDGSGVTSDLVPTGIAEFPIGRTVPFEVESSELSEWRGGRDSTYQFARAGEVTLDLLVPPTLWPTLEESALVSGFGAINVEIDDASAYSEAHPDGTTIVYPLDAEVEDRQWTDETVAVHVRGTVDDPGVSPPTPQVTAWATLWRAGVYGYSVHYVAKIEGIPILPVEVTGDGIAPSGYTIDASLVIDRSARIGSVVSPSTHFSAGFDLEVRLLDTPAVRAMMSRPTVTTRLRDDCAAVDTALLVDSVAGLSGVTPVYLGTSAEVVTGILPGWLTVPTRGVYGRIRSYRKGTLVTDAPVTWEGRRVELYAVLRDPCGNYVQGADILSDAVMVGAFYVQGRPVRDGSEWVIQCRDQVRRLTQPLGVAASGRAVWEVDDDGLVTVDPQVAFAFSLDIDGTTIENHTLRPFAGMSGQLRRSEMRAIVADALDAAVVTSGDVSDFRWRRGVDAPLGSDAYDVYGLFCTYAAAGTEEVGLVVVGVQPFTSESSRLWNQGSDSFSLAGPAGDVEIYCKLRQVTTAGAISLSVVMDDGAPDLVPAAGWIQMESEGRTSYRLYSDASVDTEDPSRVNLTIDAATPFTTDEVQAVIEGTIADVSVKFFWRDTGRIYDILRRAIVSTGDAQHGTYDTLPKGQGLGLPDIDEDSFTDTFDVFFRDLQMTVGADAGTDLEELFSGILRLSQRAIVSRRSSDATQINIAAAYVGSVNALPVVTITDATLASDGRKPIRVRDVYAAPRAIGVKCRTLPVGDVPNADASIALSDPHLVDWTGVQWTLDIYGVTRSSLLAAAKAWATAWFRAGENRQVIELDVPPYIDAQPGDIVELDLVDPNLWDYAADTGAPGYSGMARVLGAQLALTTGLQTLTVAADGIYTSGPMCPSLPISAVNGGGSTPTSIDVDDAYYDLLVAAKDGATSWKLLAYLPGQDSGRAEYTISTVTLPGGGVARLTVPAYPSTPAVTLSTSHRLTWPVASECTDDQDRYLHNTDRAQWS